MTAKSKYVKHFAETIYVGEFIDLKKVQEHLKHYSYLNRDHPLILRLLKDQYVVLTKFGTVTFWGVNQSLRRQFLSEIKPYLKGKREYYPFDEQTRISVGVENDRVTFDDIYLHKLDIEHIKIISYVLSQSVALERYEEEIEESLGRVGVVIENLKNTGRALLNQRTLLKQIGQVLSVKQTAVAHLALFDKPEEIWESPDLENLYNRLSAEYELRIRFDVLDEKIQHLSDISQMLMNFLAEKRNEFLEIIIIVLIALEIILLFVPAPNSLVNLFTH